MTDKAISLGKTFGPWAGLTGMVLLAAINFWGNHGAEASQIKNHGEQIQRLDDKKADRREMDDLKEWMKRIDTKLDKMNDKLDQRSR